MTISARLELKMAKSNGERGTNSLLDVIQDSLCDVLSTFCLDHHHRGNVPKVAQLKMGIKISIARGTQRHHADLFVNLGALKIKDSDWKSVTEAIVKAFHSQEDNGDEGKQSPLAHYPQTHIITSVIPTRDHQFIHIKLNQLNVFQNIIPQVHIANNNYGRPLTTPTNHDAMTTIICPVYKCTGCIYIDRQPQCGISDDHTHSLSIEDGRVLLVAGLLSRLVSMQNDCSVSTIHNKCPSLQVTSKHFCEISDSLVGQSPAASVVSMDTTAASETNTKQQYRERVLFSRLKEYEGTAVNDGDSLIVDTEGFIHRKDISWHTRSIKAIEVKKQNVVSIVGTLAASLLELVLLIKSRRKAVVIVTNQRNSFLCQQVIILTLICLTEDEYKDTSIKLLEVGPVKCPVAVHRSCVEKYVVSKLAEVRNACEMKYGPIEEDPSLRVTVSTMVDAAVKFDMLGTEPQKTLKLDVGGTRGSGGGGVSGLDGDARSEGVFILYNYARLATLERNYAAAVEKGVYPPLPVELAGVDYSLLTNEEEWELMLSYVALFPSLLKEVSDIVGDDRPSSLTLHSVHGLKKVCQFLCRMCHAFSGYYSRYKILLGPEPHLLPLIQARMSLILALKQVLFNGLQILGIRPVDQL